jgi:hypothetical protein
MKRPSIKKSIRNVKDHMLYFDMWLEGRGIDFDGKRWKPGMPALNVWDIREGVASLLALTPLAFAVFCGMFRDMFLEWWNNG